jgi:dienelactone hydrolase
MKENRCPTGSNHLDSLRPLIPEVPVRASLVSLLLLTLISPILGAPKSRPVEYKLDTVSLQGILVSEGGGKNKPGVVLFTDWMGVGDHAQSQAEKVARMGYVVFVADIYGKGKNPKDTKEAGATAGIYKADRNLMRQRAAAGLAQLKASAGVDTTRLGAMGFCFGGTVALELARSGADLDATVSFHGNLDTPDPSLAKNIKGSVLVLHGADDPYVPADQVKAFQEEMRAAKVDWYMTAFGGAVHSFTKPAAGNDPSKGSAYHPKADARSFEELKDFLADSFAPKVAGK